VILISGFLCFFSQVEEEDELEHEELEDEDEEQELSFFFSHCLLRMHLICLFLAS
jgi:hypothetical protein